MCARLSLGSICSARRKASAPSLYLNCSSNATPMLLARYASSRVVIFGWVCNFADDVLGWKNRVANAARHIRQKKTDLRFVMVDIGNNSLRQGQFNLQIDH